MEDADSSDGSIRSRSDSKLIPLPTAGSARMGDGPCKADAAQRVKSSAQCIPTTEHQEWQVDDVSSPTTEEGSDDGSFEEEQCVPLEHRFRAFDQECAALEMGKPSTRRVEQLRDTTDAVAKQAVDAAWSSNVRMGKADGGCLTPRGAKLKVQKKQEHGLLETFEGQGSCQRSIKSGVRHAQPAEEPDSDMVCLDVYVAEHSSASSTEILDESAPLLGSKSRCDSGWKFLYKSQSTPDLKAEFWLLCELSYPVIFTYVLEFFPGIVSMTLVGHMDSPKTKEYVDGVSMSSMFMNLTAVAFGFGLATAMDTLCSQAYGAGKPMKMGVYLQSGLIVLGLAAVPVFILNWYTTEFLLWMGQPVEVAELAGRFSKVVLPGIPFLYVYELFKKLLQAQNVVKPMVYIAVISNVINVVLGVYLTFYTSWGYDGAAIARTLANIALPACLIPYFMWNPHVLREWWSGWKIDAAMAHLGTFLTLGVPGMFMMLLEWWSFEIMAAFVGLLPNSVVAISVHSVLVNVSTMAFNFFLGISVACNIRVGNFVGSNQPAHAKMVSYLAMGLSLSVSAVLAVLIILSRTLLPHIFINDATTITLASHALLFLMPFQFMDAWNSVMQGVFRGIGQQMLGTYINFVAYFIVGLPVGIYFAFRLSLGVEGLWLGLTAGIAVGCIVSIYKIYYTDWEEMADAARMRTS